MDFMLKQWVFYLNSLEETERGQSVVFLFFIKYYLFTDIS